MATGAAGAVAHAIAGANVGGDGEVTLDGRLDRRTVVDLAGRLAAQVSGVVRVVNTVAYDVDDTTLVELDPGQVTPVA